MKVVVGLRLKRWKGWMGRCQGGDEDEGCVGAYWHVFQSSGWTVASATGQRTPSTTCTHHGPAKFAYRLVICPLFTGQACLQSPSAATAPTITAPLPSRTHPPCPNTADSRSDTSTDTYFIPAPTKTAVLASHEPTRSGVRVTAATAVVPSGSIQAVGDMQTSRASAQESAASASAASGAGRRSLPAGVGVVVVVGAVALAAAL